MNAARRFLYRCIALLPLAWSLGTGTAHGKTAGLAKAPAQAQAARHAEAAGHHAAGRKAQAPGAGRAKAGARKSSAAQRTKATAAKAPALRAARARAAAPAGLGGSKAVARKAASAKGATVARKAAAAKGSSIARRAAASGARLDFSGRRRVGEASYYAHKFAGRKMADGTRMRLNHHNAASKTLPLGTIAKVTNLKTGKSAVVKIQDRGPFVKGRIVDLSPATARQIGLTAKEGVGPVAVTPIAVPLPDGSVKPGEAAREPMARTQVAQGRGD